MLEASLTGARSSLSKFDDLLQYRILKPSKAIINSIAQQKVMKRKWLLEKKRIEKLRNEIRQARSDLFNIIELAGLYDELTLDGRHR